MPANLPPQYTRPRTSSARPPTPAERLEKLREMFRLLPKHKGTEKLQSDLKQKISRLKDEIEGAKAGGKKGGVSHRVPHEGAGQVVLVGPPNAGKSAILAALTNARPEVAAYPFTTRAPQPGIMIWQDVPVQLVDLPPISRRVPRALGPRPDPLGRRRAAGGRPGQRRRGRRGRGGPRAAGASPHRAGRRRCPSTSRTRRSGTSRRSWSPTSSTPTGAADRLEVLREWFEPRFPILAGLGRGRAKGWKRSRDAAYDLLGVMRVYTKVPGKPADRSKPFTVPIGSTVLDLAREIHATSSSR